MFLPTGATATDRDCKASSDSALSIELSSQIFAALFIVGGFVAFLGPLIPAFPVDNRAGMILVGAVAVTVGLALLKFPLAQTGRIRLLWTAPPAFLLIALLNYFGGAEPYRYSVFFMVLFVAIGITHPSGTSLRMLPLLLIAYLWPLAISERFSLAAATSVVYVVPVCLLVGETLAWVTTELRAARSDVVNNQARFKSLVMNATDMIVVVDPNGSLMYISPSSSKVMSSYLLDDPAGVSIFRYVHPDDQADFRRFLMSCMRQTEHMPLVELRFKVEDGSWRDVEVVGNNLCDDPNVGGIVITARDITERRTLESQLAHLAFHDALTGLPNRALFVERTTYAFASIGRHFHGIAVLFIDLDRFKLINDSLGHETGDRVLTIMGTRLKSHVRQGDTVARLGSDEYAILLQDISETDDALETVERIRSAITQPMRFDGHDVHISASIGVALSTNAADDPDHILRSAEAAMYQAKWNGKDHFEVFDSTLDLDMLDRLKVENDMRLAIERHEFAVYYQPRVSLTTGKYLGVEALVRWNHPVRGILSPAEFIPLSEENGMIVSIGRQVLVEACRQARFWRDEYPGLPPVLMSVNISARQLRDPDIVKDIVSVLRETGLTPQQLELEITETTLVEDAQSSVSIFAALKNLGIRIAVDDFGTGYSSLSYLKNFPLDVVKIDRSFVNGLGSGSDDAAIISAIVEIAHTLGLEVVAEGIETAEQLARLRELGCDIGQGYYLARPVPSTESETYFLTLYQQALQIPRTA